MLRILTGKSPVALAAIAALTAVTATAGEIQLEIDATATEVVFSLPAMLHTVHGAFKVKSGRIRFDPSSGKASGEITVDATSGESGNNGRDSRMHKNVLESPRFPEISLVPDRFDGTLKLEGDSDVVLHGVFRIHGAEHELTIPTHVSIDGENLIATLKFSVPYVAWGMKNPSTLLLRVPDMVRIEAHAAGHLKALPAASGR